MGTTAFLAVGAGAVLGAWLRWGLGALLNPLLPTLPLGTLAANLVGGLAIGVVLGSFEQFLSLSAETRLFLVTGFLGALTTFSTFSGEAASLLLRAQYGWFVGHVFLHLAGSLGMTLLGFVLIRALLRA